jgi:predicted MFS family arabinose efflux permease
MPAGLILVLAAACGLIAANLYYAQPLISLIAPDIGLQQSFAGVILTLTQVGYCAGLVLLVPLGDLIENRKLVLWTLSGAIIALLVSATAHSAPVYLAAALAIGLGSVAVQMLVPIAAHLASDAHRGRVVGNVMSGLLVGIMLARPVSSLIANAFGWRPVFGMSAAMMVLVGASLLRWLPQRRPAAGQGYEALIASLWTVVRDTPLLRRRALYQAALFAAFSLYWTAVPLVLMSPLVGLTQRGIALFSLAGVAGALAAPVAGRLADRGHTRIATGMALATVALSFLVAWTGRSGSLAALLTAGILLDLGVQANLVLGQRTIYTLGAHLRGRLTGLFMAMMFAGGAIGSLLASLAFTRGGWALVSWIGLGFPLAALFLYCIERQPRMDCSKTCESTA